MMNHKRMVEVLGLAVLATGLFFYVSSVWGHVPPDVTLVDGRMTGGGSIFTSGDDLINGVPQPGTEIRITHGFELHCSTDIVPNNLQINVHLPNGEGSRFHVELLTFVACWDDPNYEPKPPVAPFDHYFGAAAGRYNGESGWCAQWLFTDAGEPGTKDEIRYLRIWKCSPVDEPPVVWIEEPGHFLTNGNHQAHYEKKKNE